MQVVAEMKEHHRQEVQAECKEQPWAKDRRLGIPVGMQEIAATKKRRHGNWQGQTTLHGRSLSVFQVFRSVEPPLECAEKFEADECAKGHKKHEDDTHGGG